MSNIFILNFPQVETEEPRLVSLNSVETELIPVELPSAAEIKC
jgi:hypothetical protein